jgi:hypothetical protein
VSCPVLSVCGAEGQVNLVEIEEGKLTIDLHGYHLSEIVWNGVLGKIVQQSWEMGEPYLYLIHGHGRNRGILPGFVNTNTAILD